MTDLNPKGEFTSPWKTSGQTCRKCAGANVVYREWESSCGGYEDYQYRCNDCDHSWWFDGIDA